MTGTTALREYWQDDKLEKSTLAKGETIGRALKEIVEAHPSVPMQPKGRGLARGLAFDTGDLAGSVCSQAFERGLLIETSGPDGEVAKLMPALTVTDDEVEEGLRLVAESVAAAVG